VPNRVVPAYTDPFKNSLIIDATSKQAGLCRYLNYLEIVKIQDSVKA
jgi:hypothetical protein